MATIPPRISAASAGKIRVWDLSLRLFHWSLVGAVALAFLSSEEDGALAAWHIPAGWIAALLITFRLVWGVIGGEHARFANFVKPSKIGAHLGDLVRGRLEPSLGHNPLGALAVLGLLGLVAATVASGALLGASGDEDLHEAVAYGLLALIAVHVLAVVVMSLVTRDNLPRAMVTGFKDRALHPGAGDAEPPAPWAAPVALVVAAGAASAILLSDPTAFKPGIRGEAGDHARNGESEQEHGRDADDEHD